MSRILVVEDERHLADGLRFNLEADDHEVDLADTGEEALRLLTEQPRRYDLVVLDVMLPGINGFEVTAELRRQQLYVPVLILTARGRSDDVLSGFGSGADDYLTKPFELPIFLSRVRGLLRRHEWFRLDVQKQPGPAAPPLAEFAFAGKVIDFEQLEVRVGERRMPLTLMEASLLRYFVENEGKPVARKTILDRVWNVHEDTDTRAIDNFVVRLRRYIEDEPARPRHLQTVRGVGYRFVALPEQAPKKGAAAVKGGRGRHRRCRLAAVVLRSPSSPLPPLYAAWVAEALGELPPDEQTATCDSCVMLPPERGDGSGSASTSSLFFDPRSKCCTYIPELPNFVVGRVLLDTTPDAAAGRASVVARVRAGNQVTPLGLDKPPAFAILYGNNGPELFGRAVDLRCPHYLADSGGCGIWRHRMSTCGTWFCKHDRGDVGRRAWHSVRQLLRILERAVAVHCVRTLAPGSRALLHARDEPHGRETQVRSSDLGAPLDAPAQRALWGAWAGRELAFFKACGQMAGGLTWAGIAALGGVELALAIDVARDALDATTATTIPKVVRLGALTVASADADEVTCTTYSPFDPLSIPRPLFELLHLFDGRPTRTVLAAMSAAGLDVDRRVVRRLLDHGVLVDATRANA